MPSISVVMPVYNRARFVGQAIESILAQTFRDFEFVILDDGSTDATLAVLQDYAARDPRIRLLPRQHRGLGPARIELLQQASADLVAWIDSDDLATPGRLQEQVRTMSLDQDLWILGTASAVIDENGRPLKVNRVVTGSNNVAKQMRRGCKVTQSSCIMRRDRILSIGGYRTAYAPSEDYDLFLRVSERGKIDNIEFVGLLYRSHADSVSATQNLYQNLLADLARAAHARRVTGQADPTGSLSARPDLYNEPILDELLGETIDVYRTLDRVSRGVGDPDDHLKDLIGRKVSRKQRTACQAAIVSLVRRRSFDRTSVRALFRATLMGPGRLMQLLLE